MGTSRKQNTKSRFKSSGTYRQSIPKLYSKASQEGSAANTSVNERLDHLRRSQRSANIHEPIRRIDPPVPARGQRRLLPGPAPPRSWTEATLNFKYRTDLGPTPTRRPKVLHYFPGINFPSETTLAHQALKALALDLEWHLEYDHYFLATLSSEQKALLLSYVAAFGPESGISVTGLKRTFCVDDAEFIEATSNHDIRRLDLGGSVGRIEPITKLENFWVIKPRKETNKIPETWEDAPAPAVSLRFPHLTMLSLAYPGKEASWSDLLSFSKHLGGLTHLSLAHWPKPVLSTTTASSDYWPTFAQYEQEVSQTTELVDEAAQILRHLSRNTPALTHLYLDGCQHWWRCLRRFTNTTASQKLRRLPGHQSDVMEDLSSDSNYTGVEWYGSWKRIRHLSLKGVAAPSETNALWERAFDQVRSQMYSHAFLESYTSQRCRSAEEYSNLYAKACEKLDWFSRSLQSTEIARSDYRLASMLHRVTDTEMTQLNTILQETESYNVNAPPDVAERVRANAERVVWCKQEIEALVLTRYINSVRARSEQSSVIIDHGWQARNE